MMRGSVSPDGGGKRRLENLQAPETVPPPTPPTPWSNC